MTVRLRCIVAHCQHTRGPRKGDDPPIEQGMEWICAQHWRAVPKRLRQVHNRAWNWNAGLPYRRQGSPLNRKNRKAAGRIWRRCKRAAIEAAAGIA